MLGTESPRRAGTRRILGQPPTYWRARCRWRGWRSKRAAEAEAGLGCSSTKALAVDNCEAANKLSRPYQDGGGTSLLGGERGRREQLTNGTNLQMRKGEEYRL